MNCAKHVDLSALFAPFKSAGLTLPNRIVMAPMTRCFSPGGVPGPDVASYYRRRAENEVGLIITEGTWIPHEGASNDANVPQIHGAAALAGWQRVVQEVHAAGGKIVPQLWHVGLILKPILNNLFDAPADPEHRHMGPSGIAGGIGYTLKHGLRAMTRMDIDSVIEAYCAAASTAFQCAAGSLRQPETYRWGQRF